jgi:hypothetical protein
LTCGEGPKDISQDFEDKGDWDGTQVERLIAEDLVGVQDEGEREEEDGEEGDGERGVITVDYYWCTWRVLAGCILVLGEVKWNYS